MKKTISGRVIVTYGRSLIALMIARSLAPRGVEVIGCDDVDMTALSFSKYVKENVRYKNPEEDEKAFIDSLEEIIKKFKPEGDMPYVLMPSFREAKIIARYKERLGKHITVATPDASCIDAVMPKNHFAKTVKKHDIEAPQTWVVSDVDDLDTIIKEAKFPVFVKPSDDVGGRGVEQIKNKEDLQPALKALRKDYPNQEILVQEAAKGVDYCFCGLYKDGKRLASMVYHNIRKFPRKSGPGVVRKAVDPQKFNPLADKLMEALKWDGVVEVDFMWDEKEENTPQIIEVNPRFWSSLDHSIRSGIDFPWLLWQMLAEGKTDFDDEAKVGHTTKVPQLSDLAKYEAFFGDALDVDALTDKWPDIEQRLKDGNLWSAVKLFVNSASDVVQLDKAYEMFKAMGAENKDADELPYTKDDPLVVLGGLFVVGSLLRHGKLPPEVKR